MSKRTYARHSSALCRTTKYAAIYGKSVFFDVTELKVIMSLEDKLEADERMGRLVQEFGVEGFID